MDDLTRVAVAMGYTDLRRRLVKAYQADSADLGPNTLGDPRLEDKIAAKLRSYGPNGFLLLLRELSEDLPDMHVQARRELAEYAIRLREGMPPTSLAEAPPITYLQATPHTAPTTQVGAAQAAGLAPDTAA